MTYLNKIASSDFDFDFGVVVSTSPDVWEEIENYLDKHITSGVESLTNLDYKLILALLSRVPDSKKSGEGFVAAAKAAILVAACFANSKFNCSADFVEGGVGLVGTSRVCRWLSDGGYLHDSSAITALVSMGYVLASEKGTYQVHQNRSKLLPLLPESVSIMRNACCSICRCTSGAISATS